jgi:hypothetical protein
MRLRITEPADLGRSAGKRLSDRTCDMPQFQATLVTSTNRSLLPKRRRRPVRNAVIADIALALRAPRASQEE